MRITRFGANGPTGRLLTAQALEAGHRITEVTRQPNAFPLRHAQLDVVGADVLDPAASMLAMPDNNRYVSTTVSVVTTLNNPSLLRWIRTEALAAKEAGSPAVVAPMPHRSHQN
jgi:putative NADH-flavin reductase